MTTYQELMAKRRIALKQKPRDMATAERLFKEAMKLVEDGKVSDDEILAAHL